MTENPPVRLTEAIATRIAEAISRDARVQDIPDGLEYQKAYRAATERAADVVRELAGGQPIRLWDSGTVAEYLGVQPQTVRSWRVRYAGTDHPCPEPDGWVGAKKPVPVWFPERAAEWREWDKNRLVAGRWPDTAEKE